MTLRCCMEQKDRAGFISCIEQMIREMEEYCVLPRAAQLELYFNVWICTGEEFRWFESYEDTLTDSHQKLQRLLRHYDETLAQYTDADAMGARGYMLYVMPANYEWLAYEYAEQLGSQLLANAHAQAPENPIWQYFQSNNTEERNRLSPFVQAALKKKWKGCTELLHYFLEMSATE